MDLQKYKCKWDDFLHPLTQKEVADEYRQKGYDVLQDVDTGYEGVKADIVAKKRDRGIVFEINSRDRASVRRKRITAVSRFAESNGYDFYSVLPPRPKITEVKIDHFGSLMTRYFREHLPEELGKLSDETILTDVDHIDIDEMSLEPDGIYVTGDADFEITLKYKPERKMENPEEYDSIPFDFKMKLEYGSQKQLLIDENSVKTEIHVPEYY